MGLNATLATASRSLEVFTAGIQVTGQNIANASTPGYIREELLLEAGQPFAKSGLVFGTGVIAGGIVQQIDKFLEQRIHAANSDFTASDAKQLILQQLEGEIRELGEGDLSTSLSDFLATINDVVNQPESGSLRHLVVQQGERLAGDIGSLRARIDELRKAQSIDVDQLVKESNSLIDKIAELNTQISSTEAAGLLKSDAGGLRTQRYTALSRLSEIVPVRFVERKSGAVDVFSGSDFLVLTGQTQHFETVAVGDREVTVANVRTTQTKSIVGNTGRGELSGILEGRDVFLGGFVDDLNTYTSNLIFAFNSIHTSGEGLKGFESLTSEIRVSDSDTALNAVGLPFTPTHGSFQLKVTNKLTGATTTTDIAVDLDGIGVDTTLETLRADIDAALNVNATITTTGKLEIDSDTNFEFRFSDDTSGVLASLGLNTFFSGSDSSSISINSIVANDPGFFAASKGGGPSDNDNAIKLAEFAVNPVSALGEISIDEFYSAMVATTTQAPPTETSIAEGLRAFRDSLNNQRAQFSGVSLDEEAIQIIEFQKAFQAAARMVSTIDELYTILLTM